MLPPVDQTPPISDTLLRLPVFAGPSPRFTPPPSHAQDIPPSSLSTLQTNRGQEKKVAGAKSMLNLSTVMIHEEDEAPDEQGDGHRDVSEEVVDAQQQQQQQQRRG